MGHGIRRNGLAHAAGLLAFACTLGLAQPIASAPQRCLPPPNCGSRAECCKFPEDCLYREGIADAKFRHDFYQDRRNQDKAWKEYEEATRSKGHVPNKNSEYDLGQAAIVLQESFKKAADLAHAKMLHDRGGRCPGALDPVTIDYKTTDNCEIVPVGDERAQNTCQEFLDAARAHEEEHQAICEILRDGTKEQKDKLTKQLGGSPKSLSGSANNEKRGYAAEMNQLRRWRDEARLRCTTAKMFPPARFPNEEVRQKKIDEWTSKAMAARRGGGKR
jgi:hypothetical protein